METPAEANPALILVGPLLRQTLHHEAPNHPHLLLRQVHRIQGLQRVKNRIVACGHLGRVGLYHLRLSVMRSLAPVLHRLKGLLCILQDCGAVIDHIVADAEKLHELPGAVRPSIL